MRPPANEDEARLRVMMLRDLERAFAENGPEHVALLGAIRELIVESEAQARQHADRKREG